MGDLWHCGVVVITTAQLHSTKPELRFYAGSYPACSMSEIRNGEDLWQWSWLEIRIKAFHQSTIPQKQCIIIIIIIIIIKGRQKLTVTFICLSILHSNHINQKIYFNISRVEKNFKKTLWALFMDRVQQPQGYSHLEEAVYL